jgi:acetyl esterase/lipase
MPLRLAFLALALAVAAPLRAATARFPATPLGEPHVYKTVAEHALRLYVVKPADWRAADRRPAIVFFHGGGWTSGHVSQFDEHCRYLAARGLVCVQVEYRLLDPKRNDPPLVCIRDAKSAVRWVRAHAAALGIDPDRIAAGGGSAGGHLAAFVGLGEGNDDPQDDPAVSARVQALVLFNPVFDNGPDGGWGYERVGARYREFSPAHQVRPGAPPTIVFLGTQDRLVPVATVERFQAAMRRAGARCDAVFYPGQEHAFFNYGTGDSTFYYETVLAADRFLASLGWISGPPTLVRPAAAPAPLSSSSP